ncbi:sialate O-acetylesterase [Pelagicoccus sp. SDUM812002]|uniref:sialate O-acetylesterase n=1 Tax=Pelagicoccus sp. SDUM812002 TaxID=3041266 RepID=UPI00280CDDEA|nr:sialate O-acetylesterase [Pelagicoccus sp. SDUM812002]MDQ8184320.1 sialate O-acetylesterase [Pelagicoccus sp. SDUM812002]
MKGSFPALLALITIFAPAGPLSAEIKLPSIVGNDMVLQRDQKLTIWGWADPSEKVSVSFRGDEESTTADSQGNWSLILPEQKAGGPDNMEINGSNHITLTDVMVGDVWLASGQSNMTHTFNRWKDEYATEIATSENPEIRQFQVPTKAVLSRPLDDYPGLEWKKANPDNLLDFTVVGYSFAKALYERYGIPQGIIMSCVGGTRIEAWTSEEGFRTFPEELATIQRNKDSEYIDRINAEAKADREANPGLETVDAGNVAEPKWYATDYEPLNWKPINIPGYWEHQGIRDLDGVVWYRKEIEIPNSMVGVEVLAKLGRIRNADDFYVNGVRVGGTGYEYPQRRYTIPADLLHPGKNLFVIRVSNQSGNGGFIPDKPYQLEADDQIVDLKGTWHYRVGEVYRPNPYQYKRGIDAGSQPSSLYNAMIAPFTSYGIKGILWYQGESNAGNPQAYAKLLPNLIKDWRNQFGSDDIAFYIAQLPNFMDVDYLPAESGWAAMREAQLDTARSTPLTGLGINIELGEWNDIHPGGKWTVGERLALQARKISYGEDIVSSGPIFKSQEIKDGEIILTFDNVGSGLTSTNDEELAHFAIAGESKQFVWGKAEILGDNVVVSSEEIPEPKYVRYAWADNPDFANLGNEEGLPAAPFRTDR